MTPDQLLERRRFIGASEAAAACGLSPWTTPFELWQSKRGDAPDQSDNDSMQWGRRLELAIIGRYIEDSSEPVEYPCASIVHPEYPWMRATPDALSPSRVIEVKTARSAHDWGEAGSADVPLQYLLQVTHQMIVTGQQLADVAVLIGGSDYRVYSVPLDEELAALLIAREAEFWQAVESGTPPDVKSIKDATARWPKDTGTSVVATVEVAVAVMKLFEIEAQQKALEADAEALGLAVRTCMADATTLVDDGGRTLCTWKTQQRSQLNFSALKAAHPAIYAEYTEKHPSRVFRLNRSLKT